MNSEELELSLRTEFESYLKGVLADMRRDAAEFQSGIITDLEEQKARFEEAFQSFSARFESEREFDEAFRGSVSEHLRLARDEGARITANAMAEAEKLDKSAPAEPKYDAIRDAVDEISGKDSQSAILKSLVSHAANFAPRGAFFIIKNEHFVGWKVFGADTEPAEAAVREIHFPVSADSILAAAARSLATADGSAGEGDAAFTEPLEFGQPDKMYAIPLVARGRGVAVLYADHGTDGASLNLEALETLVRVAGLTVELLASTQTAKAENRAVGAADFEDAQHEAAGEETPAGETGFEGAMPVEPAETQSVMPDSSAFSYQDSGSFEAPETAPSFATPQPFEPSHPFDNRESFETPQSFDAPQPFEAPRHDESTYADSGRESSFDEPAMKEPAFEEPVSPAFETAETKSGGAIVFDSGGSIESAAFGSSPFDKAAAEYEPAAAISGGFNPALEPAAQVPAATEPKARLSDRPVDLPIEVPDEERRIHNDARRFARLLVSEIKLYNEKKVLEGREANDLYERLREAIDRSREMYDKRVQPPVAAKFDYFHYEVVNALADGNAERLGASYPGSTV